MDNSGNPRIRVAAIIIEDGKILLARHVKANKTYWLLPGGGVDFGESLADALVRELKEEACIDISIGHLVMANDSIPPDKHRHIVNLYFTASICGSELKLGSDERVAEILFVPLNQLQELTFYPDIRSELLSAIKHSFSNNR